MTVETKLITAEELLCMPDDGIPRELINGRIVELMPPTYRHNRIMSRLTIRIGAYVSERKLGEVIPGDVGIVLSRGPDTVRGPDICFISTERLPSDEASDAFLETVPDLIIEIVSPSDRMSAGRKKNADWLRAGAKLVVTIYPKTQRVVVVQPDGTERVYQAGQTLTLEPVLPDFSIPVVDIFS